MKQTTIERDGHTWSYTLKTYDGKVAIHEGGFVKREAAAVQAAAALGDLHRLERETRLDVIHCPKCGKSYDTDFTVPDYVYCSDCDYVLRTSD